MPSETKPLRAAIYARYSSDNQRDESIDDQERVCRVELARHGWDLVQVYDDPRISGASTFRPGYQKLLQDASAGALDVVVAESLDRLSRDLADTATLYKHLSFLGVPLWTVVEGQINDLHVGLKGTMNALYLKDLAQKTHRGLEGRVRSGMSAGGIGYGYALVPGHQGHCGSMRRRRRSSSGSSRNTPPAGVRGRSPWGSIRTPSPALGVEHGATPPFVDTSFAAPAS